MSDAPGSVPENLHPEVSEAQDAAKPAGAEVKKQLLDIIDEKLKDESPSKYDPHKKGKDFTIRETNTPISIFRYDSPESNLGRFLATIVVVDWAHGKTGGACIITNYHFREGPDELSVEKLTHYDENRPFEPPIDASEGIKQVTEQLERLNAFVKATVEEREAGLTIFTQQDAINLRNLLIKAAPYT